MPFTLKKNTSYLFSKVAAAWNLTAKGLHGNFFEFKVETPMATDTCGGKRYRFCRAC
jgi:hypothetical protein